ncbi:prolyl-tRNA editing protein ProX [Variibacter gotjawalensis]|uniref:Prolyl-tRNA editing protein ProX n=1 Tax=Variibacter gotjawalensis TaxID=1333996 RepID=A0A0S3PQA2_9BRAD|nr:YbaK/EbsC family protein [Variibacter gotjawalensis]NIK48417.1 Ala-tRNA(Pro) deacylase [Variibacter gotjawalensis]RZS50284.1 Ala-tRNA(Pro) hydrolase [Variibacter gotjawalensis]BAT58117.1 prolyl-tRNA editing protein ProX [Variibacter gotjawalensis]
MKTPADLFAFLDSHAIPHTTIEHPAVFTVEESKSLRGTIPGSHTKNLFLKDKKGALFLMVAQEDTVIPLKSLHTLVGASGRFSFGSADLLREVWGVEPGSVTPFGAINDTECRVNVLLDAAMLRNEPLNYHPLQNTMTTSVSRDGLMRFFAATGHAPRILDFEAAV